MTSTSLAEGRHPDTRELRAIHLYRTRGHEIRRAGEDLYLVPSCTGRGFYSVDYREETCDCPDHQIRRENCKHILAVGIHHAKHQRSSRRLASPHACNGGWVSIGQIALDEGTGAEVEETALYLCRRCIPGEEEEG